MEALCCSDAAPAASPGGGAGGVPGDCGPFAPPTPDGVPASQTAAAWAPGLLGGGRHGSLGDDPCRVVTCFEGQIVDGRRHSFQTNNWSADARVDATHWGRLPGFADARQGEVGGCTEAAHPNHHIFMRWKETAFLSTPAAAGDADSDVKPESVTISGFYYVSLDAHSGSISCVYFDPKCVPFQRLAMRPVAAGRDPWLEAGRTPCEQEDDDETAAFSFCAAPPPPLSGRRQGMYQ